MSLDRPSYAYTHTDLFLVRIWTRGAGSATDDGADHGMEAGREAIPEIQWRGTVQRAVDGEAHQFSSWQGLLDLLLVMLSDTKRR